MESLNLSVESILSKKEYRLANLNLEIESMTQIGGPNKKYNEDAFAIKADEDTLVAVLVDGGTQVEPVASLGDLSGGKYVSDRVIDGFLSIDPGQDSSSSLNALNTYLRSDIDAKHPDIIFNEGSMNIPYGSIAFLRIDGNERTLDAANAGDAFILATDTDNNPTLLTTDDVHEKDDATFKVAQSIANEYGVTVREAMEKRDKDPRFRGIIEEMYETVRQSNVGKIRRITGADNFHPTSSRKIPLDGVQEVLLFSDGAIPANIDIHTEAGMKTFMQLINNHGVSGLLESIYEEAKKDPDFEDKPRFRDIDDFSIVRIRIKEAK